MKKLFLSLACVLFLAGSAWAISVNVLRGAGGVVNNIVYQDSVFGPIFDGVWNLELAVDNGDCVIAIVGAISDLDATAIVDDNGIVASWTEIASTLDGSSCVQEVFETRAYYGFASSAGTVSINHGDSTACAVLLEYDGITSSSPVDMTDGAVAVAAGTSTDSTSSSTSTAAVVVIGYTTYMGDYGSISTCNMTQRIVDYDNVFSGVSIHVQDENKTSTGSYGSTTTISPTARCWTAGVVALKSE